MWARHLRGHIPERLVENRAGQLGSNQVRVDFGGSLDPNDGHDHVSLYRHHGYRL
jgi:hypothetical protein